MVTDPNTGYETHIPVTALYNNPGQTDDIINLTTSRIKSITDALSAFRTTRGRPHSARQINGGHRWPVMAIALQILSRITLTFHLPLQAV